MKPTLNFSIQPIQFIKHLFILVLLLGVLSACSSDDNSSEEGTARVSVQLTDAPGDYDAVFIDVQDVVVKYNGSDDEVSIGDINTGVYDLLELTGGVTVLLADAEIPEGSISQMRLVLGPNNTVVVNGETLPLDTPSAQQSGLKLQINETLEDGIFYEFILDFDVEESIVARGNGSYGLKPVIRASTIAESGAIMGSVIPAGEQVVVSATDGVNTISAYTDAVGQYFLRGVPAGTYTVTVTSEADPTTPVATVEDVVVVTGEVTALTTIEI